jgi:O-glycosyl hydrolase
MISKYAAACLAVAFSAQAESFVTDAQGRLTAVIDKGERLSIQSDVIDDADSHPKHRWSAAGTGAVLSSEGKAGQFAIILPRAEFAGGAVGAAPIPSNRFEPFRVSAAAPIQVKGRSWTIQISVDPSWTAQLGEMWNRQGRFYVLGVDVPAGATELARVTWTAQPNTTPAKLTLDIARTRFRFHGFGGNYCFNTDSPVTEYTLANLPSAWARVEMNSQEWEPENDNESPDQTDLTKLKANDKEGTKLHRDFLLSRRIQDKKLPYVISVWKLPEWLYSDPGQQPASAQRRKVPPEKWPEFLEHIGSYLTYMKEQYGAEPDLFSFNESNIGVNVIFTPDEHREAIKSIGAHLRKLGLKTKMLLGDATGPRGTHVWALPAASDTEALKYVGAVAFHSWEGGLPEHYAAWGDLAEWVNLPLLVAEVGVDAFAWRGQVYDSFDYGMREVEMYQELLLHARPQGFLQWEYTGDYGLARVDPASGKVEPTARFWFLKQFSELTPMHSDALATSSDHPKVLLTAFRGSGRTVLHVSNTGPARDVTITGIPAALQQMRMVRTSATESFASSGRVTAEAGTLKLRLPERCLVSLIGE